MNLCPFVAHHVVCTSPGWRISRQARFFPSAPIQSEPVRLAEVSDGGPAGPPYRFSLVHR